MWWMDRIARVGWGLGFRCRVGVLLFGASIDGSLWYGDLPALDGARDDTHSLGPPGELRKAP